MLMVIVSGACSLAAAQGTGAFASRGLFTASASIGPGFMLQQPRTNIYVAGDWNYFLEDRISLSGYGAWFIDQQQDNARLVQNSQLSFGPVYHWSRGRADIGLGFMPGVSFARLRSPGSAEDPAPTKAIPHVSLSGKATYYVWRYLHFFANVRYVHARFSGDPGGSYPLDEIIVTGGLGWQVRL